MAQIVKDKTGLEDPYKELKTRDFEGALKVEPIIRKFAAAQEDQLLGALKVAATGNVMDTAIFIDLDISEVVEEELDTHFTICDIEAFRKDLETAKTVLILADNVGELIFDKILLELLAKDHEVIFAVRDIPIVNDATVEEALAAGIDKIAKVMSSGSRLPGTVLSQTSEEFQKVFYESDVVLAKGMGNYEGLSEVDRRVFFLLKAKCAPVAADAGVEVGQYVFELHDPALEK